MKPHELFREATQDYSRTIVLDGIVLRERQNRQVEGFRQRAATIMDEVEFLAPEIRDGLDFEQFKPVRHNGSSEILWGGQFRHSLGHPIVRYRDYA